MYMGTVLRIVAVGIAVAVAFDAEAKDNFPVEIVPQVSYSQAVNQVALSPDGRLAAFGSNNVLRLWDIASGKALRSFIGHTQPISALAFSPDSRFIISGSSSVPPRTGELKLWDVASGREMRDFGLNTPVGSVDSSPDGRTVLCDCDLWDLASGRKLRSVCRNFLPLAFSPDGRFLVSKAFQNQDTHTLWI